MSNVAVSKVVLDRPSVVTVAGQLVPGAVSQHVGMDLCPARLTIQLKLSVVNGPPRSLMNTKGPVDSLRACAARAIRRRGLDE